MLYKITIHISSVVSFWLTGKILVRSSSEVKVLCNFLKNIHEEYLRSLNLKILIIKKSCLTVFLGRRRIWQFAIEIFYLHYCLCISPLFVHALQALCWSNKIQVMNKFLSASHKQVFKSFQLGRCLEVGQLFAWITLFWCAWICFSRFFICIYVEHK